MKKLLLILTTIFLSLLTPCKSFSQIGDIKDLANGAGDIFSGCSGSDVDAGCSALSCCWDGGFYFIDFLIDHHKEIMNMRYLDPTVLSFEINGQFAYALHFAHDTVFNYINYLPEVRGNLGIFSTDFRFNMLTEYTNDFPNSFKSWELLFLLNIIPDESFKIIFGSGIYNETFTDSYYNENYLEFKIGMPNQHDFIDMDSRVVFDYSTSKLPFFEGGIRYNTRIISFSHVYAYITLGAMYQNYYSSHDIWAARGGIALNFH